MPGNLTEVYLQNEFACLHRPVSLPRPKIQILKISIHLKAFSLAVEGPAVLVPVLVGLIGGPALKVPGSSGHPDPASLMVHVSSPHPPGVLLVTANSCKNIKYIVDSYSRNCLYYNLLTDGEVHGDLVHLLLGGGLGQVGVLEVAALHRIKPVHAIPAPGISSVAGPDNTLSDIIPGDTHHAYEESNPLMSM